MVAAVLILTSLLVLPGDAPGKGETPRKPSPFAPSLPQLTDEEEENLDKIVNQFIRYDIGELHGNEAKKAHDDFQKLRPEAMFALIRGLNRAANIEASCPAVKIAEKIRALLRGSNDLELHEFVRENVGLGVTSRQHKVVLDNLRVFVIVHKGIVARRLASLGTHPEENAGPQHKSLHDMKTPDLIKAAGTAGGEQLKRVLTELSKRKGTDVIDALGVAAANPSQGVRALAKDLLTRNLARQDTPTVRKCLSNDRPTVRAAAAQVAGTKRLPTVKQLIDLLTDDDAAVRNAAHNALVRVSRGRDFGPTTRATAEQRTEAADRWREWWSRQAVADDETP
jgi:HEAT repeat protein